MGNYLFNRLNMKGGGIKGKGKGKEDWNNDKRIAGSTRKLELLVFSCVHGQWV